VSAPTFDLVQWVGSAPVGSLIPAAVVAEFLNARRESAPATRASATATAPATWRERLWTSAAETRLGVQELAEALDRPRSWVYRHTSEKSGLSLLPHRKLDGELVFVAGEIRAWIQQNETVLVAGRPSLEIRRRA
jgi:predicted DNA-binding transcriptional regulator AlpA